jgi:hypothetical protein
MAALPSHAVAPERVRDRTEGGAPETSQRVHAMPTPAKAPSLLAISVAWSLVIALIMTGISFLHQTPGEVAEVSGGLGWQQVGFLFITWFIAAEVTLVVGGALYLGVALLLRKAKGGR